LDTPGVLWPKFEDNDVAHNLAITGSIKDHVLPIEEVAMKLIDKMKKLGKIDYLVRSYGLTDYLVGKDIMELEPYEILEVLEERLIIAKKEEHNYEKVARVVLRDYRSGKIGKFFLEMPAIK
jgi:ribosome biogenesis GTPase A